MSAPTMRSQFEAWATGRGVDIAVSPWDEQAQRYVHFYVDAQWQAWQAAFLSSSKGEAEGWRDIGSAPKDGTEILALSTAPEMGGNFQQVVFWDETEAAGRGWWIVDAKCARAEGVFQYWMSLPALPSSEASS